MAYKNHRHLMVWQRSMSLTKMIYDITRNFPKEEIYGLTSQMQRAAVSIPSNIAEGYGRDSDTEFDRFLKISTGSACELDTQLEIAALNGYVSDSVKFSLLKELEEVMRLIYALRKKLDTKK